MIGRQISRLFLFVFTATLSAVTFSADRELQVQPGGMTLDAALETIRTSRKAGDSSRWTVYVEGRNDLRRTVDFTSADHDISIVGRSNAALTGGIRIRGWKEKEKGWLVAPLPKDGEGKPFYFEQLWVNGCRAERARIPNAGYLKAFNPCIELGKDPAGGKRYVEHVSITNEDERLLAAIPTDELKSAQMCIIHKWSHARRIIRGFDAASGTVESWSSADWQGWQKWNGKDTLVWFENIRSGFDAPGEWFYDEKGGVVHYRLRAGETAEGLIAVAPVGGVGKLIEFKGNWKNRDYVHNVTFSNITFAVTDASCVADATGRTELLQYQAAKDFDGAITLDGAHNVGFYNCVIAHTGNYGMRFNDGCMSNEVVGCRFFDLGAGGIWMGMRNGSGRVGRKIAYPTFPDSTAYNLISNCHFAAGGRFNPEGTAIALTHCSDTKVVHNDIHDFMYTGISVGWIWGFYGSVSQRNEISWNHISDLGQGIMSDMGGVYTLSTSFGTVVHHNLIHDIRGYIYGGWGLYCDEGSEGIVMEDNICWNTADGGFHQHFGTGCLIRNNIFAFNRDRGAVRGERPVVQGIPCKFDFVNNIVYIKSGSLVDEKIFNVGGVWANNLWYDVRGKGQARLGGVGWDEWVRRGRESGGVFADPLFANPERYDFRLADNSPAFKLGFRAIDLTGVGSTAMCEWMKK